MKLNVSSYGSYIQGWQTESEIIIKSIALVYCYKTASINSIMNTVLISDWLRYSIYSVVDNVSPSSVQLLTKLQLFLYVYFHFNHEKSNSQVPMYEYGLVHCLTGFGLLNLCFAMEYQSLVNSQLQLLHF